MSVILSDLRIYCSVNTPEADGVTCGGAIDFTKRFDFADNTAGPTLYDLVSSSASDTGVKITYQGRDSTGLISSETLTSSGTTKVPGTKTLERLEAAAITGGAIAGIANPGGVTAVGDIALIAHTLTVSAHTMASGSANATSVNPAIGKLQSGDGASAAPGMVFRTTGGTGPNQIRRILAVNPLGLGADTIAIDRNWGTIPDNTTTYEFAPGFHFELAASNGGVALSSATQVLAITRQFVGAAADVPGGSTRNYYEKGFVNNNNQSFALSVVAEILQAIAPSLPGTAALNFALANGLNDSTTIANRQTAPANATAFSSGAPPQTINEPAPGNLPASAGAASATSCQAIWWNLNLPAGTTSYKGSPGTTQRTTGNST